MAAEQPQIIISDSPYEDALDRYVGEEILGEKPEPETAAPEEDETQEVEAAPEEDNAEDEPEYVEITHNGKPVKLTLDEVIEHASKGFDYTQKTQQLADQRKQIETLAQNVQQQYQLQQATIQQTAQLYALDSQLANYKNITQNDWDVWSDQDPLEASKGWRKYQALVQQRDEVANSVQQAQTQLSQQQQYQLMQQRELALQEVPRIINGWTNELDTAYTKSAIENYGDYGVTMEALKQFAYVPGLHMMLNDAYQWRQLQAKKPEVQKRVSLAPKSAKPGGKVDDANQTRSTLLKQLKSGRSEKARRAIADSLLDKFV